MRFGIVTRVADIGTSGNLALPLDLMIETQQMNEANNWEGRSEPASKYLGPTFLSLRVPVFRVGEILILDHNDRDQFGRKPSKWDVDIEYVDTAEVVDEVRRVTAEVPA